MLTVYVASPCRAVTTFEYNNNLDRARFYARKIAEGGMAPLIPHLMYQGVLEEDKDWKLIIECTRELLKKCDEVWFFPNPDFTQGMRFEAEWAETFNKTIRLFIPIHPFRKGEPDASRQTSKRN